MTIKDNKKLTAYIGGTFDILHAGHINLIMKVKELGIKPIIVVNGDSFVEENKKNAPSVPKIERWLW